VIWSVVVVSLKFEAVEVQLSGLLVIDILCHINGYTLVRVILDIGVPKLVPDDEGQRFGGETGSLRLWHVGQLRLEGLCKLKERPRPPQGSSPWVPARAASPKGSLTVRPIEVHLVA